MAHELANSPHRTWVRVDTAFDGIEGLKRRRSRDYPVMTVDRMLPSMDGLAITYKLSAREGTVLPFT